MQPLLQELHWVFKDEKDGIEKMIKIDREFEPILENSKIYDDIYENIYKKFYKVNKPITNVLSKYEYV